MKEKKLKVNNTQNVSFYIPTSRKNCSFSDSKNTKIHLFYQIFHSPITEPTQRTKHRSYEKELQAFVCRQESPYKQKVRMKIEIHRNEKGLSGKKFN